MIFSISQGIRREYQKETGKNFEENGAIMNYVRKPTWDYVCWLEGKLDELSKQKEVEEKIG